jgi:putative FmdB family regulatory protein
MPGVPAVHALGVAAAANYRTAGPAAAAITMSGARVEMPIYEFHCEGCGCRFEELVSSEPVVVACPDCGSAQARRAFPSSISPPGRLPRGAAVRDGEARRTEREAARSERLAETRKVREAGGVPPPRSKARKP